MADYALGLGMVNTAIGAYGDYKQQQTQFKMEESARKHKAVMDGISATMQRNAMTQNEIQTLDASKRASRDISLAAMKGKAEAEVSAAAAGVGGNSVAATMRGLQRQNVNAQTARLRSVASSMEASAQQRKNLTMGLIFGRDIGTYLAPNPSAALLGLGTSLLNQYDANQPKGAQFADKLAGLIPRK